MSDKTSSATRPLSAGFDLSIQVVLTLKGIRALVQATEGFPDSHPVEVRQGDGMFSEQTMLWVEGSYPDAG